MSSYVRMLLGCFVAPLAKITTQNGQSFYSDCFFSSDPHPITEEEKKALIAHGVVVE